jgi:Fe-S-cluster formation regulator IscX/YfhJ
MPHVRNFYTAKALSICPYFSSVTPKEFEEVVLHSKLNSFEEFHHDHYRSNKMTNLSLC